MISFIFSKLALITKVRIPTLLGLGLVILGIGTGVYLLIQNQTLAVKAAVDQTPKNITVSNLTDNKATISWQTDTSTSGFVNFGVNSTEQTALDERDQSAPKSYFTHHVTLNSLTAQTTYQFKVISGKSISNIQKLTTTQTSTPSSAKPIIGTVVDKDKPLEEGLVYLAVAGEQTLSSTIKNGNFIIPIPFTLKDNSLGKISIVANNGSATVLLSLNYIDGPIGPIKLGDNLDLTVNQTAPIPIPTTTPTQNPDLLKYDLSGDGIINSSDYAVVLRNFGKSPQDKRADLNGDGVVDQKDLSEMSKKITEQKR